ncbi:MAG: response regulator [Candidatus Eisenbacteria bacterium]|uniref:Response regulator n=1 Tax=Eiseniibacteriota bacterium TaxID=2212470 RepID=A0A7Y2EBR3_UNCEI|nr:response regulator [Candidatus Eisenbacteria bacterium]
MKQRILIVDDHRDIRKAIGLRLRNENYGTSFALTVGDAIDAASTENPDLVILDLGLPDGDGFDVLSSLSEHEATAQIPVIVISAREPAGYEKHIVDTQTQGFFLKPINVNAFLESIRWVLGDAYKEAA